MSVELPDLASQLLALPVQERAILAQKLWDSLSDAEAIDSSHDDSETLKLAQERDEELSRGDVEERLHAEVMKAARRKLQYE